MKELLANRPPALTVRLEERRIGRSHFDFPSPEAQFVRAAEEVGYSAAVIARGGTSPNYAWLGPGDRWIELAVTASEPTGASAASVRPQRFVTPAPASPAELLSRYRRWVDNGDFAECFGDWLRRSRSGTRPGPLDQAMLFWLNALAAYAGLRDGRADPSDIAAAAGRAEQAIDPSDYEQVDFARRIRSMYVGDQAASPPSPPDPGASQQPTADTAGPTVKQILAEWDIRSPDVDLTRWREGMARYEAATVENREEMRASAELMCAALTHYLRGENITASSEDPSEALVRTIWNVLVVCLKGNDQTTWDAGAERHLRLALAAVRRARLQPEALGGRGTFNDVFDDQGIQMLMLAALWQMSISGPKSFTLDDWFASAPEDRSWKTP